MKLVKYIALNSIVVALMYLGIAQGVEGAANILQFWIWLVFACSFCCFTDSSLENFNKKGRAVPRYLGWAVAACFIGALVFYGWMWTAAALFVAKLINDGAHEYAAKHQDLKDQ